MSNYGSAPPSALSSPFEQPMQTIMSTNQSTSSSMPMQAMPGECHILRKF